MGRKLDAILGRNNFKTYKFKALANLAVSRLAIFKNQRQAKLNHARSDVLDLLRLGHHDRALLRVEHVIKEQSMLEVYAMMEDYCNLLVERLHLIEQERVCPDELKEAISSLLFASSRCGDFPELQEIRLLLTSRYGKDFAARAVELRNNCGVSHRMIQKMSTRQPDRETRIKLLREIATENNIALEGLDHQSSPSPSPSTAKTSQALSNAVSSKQDEVGETSAGGANSAADEIGRDGLTDSIRVKRKYKDVADAAQAAFESAAHAAAAARAAVELSRSDDPRHPDNHDKREVMTGQDEEEMEDSEPEPEPEDEEIVNDVESKAAASESKSSSSSLDPENLARKLDKEIQFDDGSNDDEEEEEETDDRIMNASESDKVEGHEAPPSAESSENIIPAVIQAGLKVDSVDAYPNVQQAASRESRTTRTLNILKAPFSVRTRHVRGY